MQPQTHPCSDKCYSLPKDGTGNEAKLVLWEAFHDWGIYHWLLRHLGHVFIHSHMFLEAISHSYSHYAVRTSLCNLIHPLSFPISSFLSVSFFHRHYAISELCSFEALYAFNFVFSQEESYNLIYKKLSSGRNFFQKMWHIVHRELIIISIYIVPYFIIVILF